MDEREMPAFCPFCGGIEIRLSMVEWLAVSQEDPDNEADVDEHQCDDCGLSFWT